MRNIYKTTIQQKANIKTGLVGAKCESSHRRSLIPDRNVLRNSHRNCH